MYLNNNKKKSIGDSIVSLGETRKKKLCICFDLIYLWYRLNFILCYPTEVLKTHLPKHLNLVRTYRQNSSASFFFFFFFRNDSEEYEFNIICFPSATVLINSVKLIKQPLKYYSYVNLKLSVAYATLPLVDVATWNVIRKGRTCRYEG